MSKPKPVVRKVSFLATLPAALLAGTGYLILIGFLEIVLRGLPLKVYLPLVCVFYGATGAVMGALAWSLVFSIFALPWIRGWLASRIRKAILVALMLAPWGILITLLVVFNYLPHSINLASVGVLILFCVILTAFTIAGARVVPNGLVDGLFMALVLVALVSLPLPLFFPPGVHQVQRGSSSASADEGLHNVVLIVIDTLRADHLSSYGYERETTPEIDELAASSVLFENVYAQAPWTQPSMASLVTSRYVSALDPAGDQVHVSDSDTTLAQVFQRNGYQTAGFIANPVVRHFGLSKGYDYYYSGLIDFNTLNLYRYWEWLDLTAFSWVANRSDVLTERAVRWLRDRPDHDRPFLLYLHYMDPHEPYQSKREYAADLSLNRAELVGKIPHPNPNFLPFDRLTDEAIDSRSRRGRIDAYDAAIRQNDASVGSLIDSMEEFGLLDSTVVVLLSDHGEEFADHGGWGHGQSLYNELVRVPLIIKSPSDDWAGLRVRTNVSLLDVLPTLSHLVLGTLPETVQGRSLLPLIKSGEGEQGSVTPSVSELFSGIGTQTSIILGSWKRIHAVKDGEELWMTFQLANDSSELNDLSPVCLSDQEQDSRFVADQDACAMGNVLDDLGRTVLGRELGLRSDTARELDGEILRQLQILGYIED